MSFKEFLRHLGQGKVRKAFMGNRGLWSRSGTKRNLKNPWPSSTSNYKSKRSWLGQKKNNIGKFMFGTRNNKNRTWLGRRKNNVETLLQKIPWFGKKVSRSRNNGKMRNMISQHSKRYS